MSGISPHDIKRNFAEIIAPEIMRRQVRRNIEGVSILHTLQQLCTQVKPQRFHKVYRDILSCIITVLAGLAI